MGAKSDILAAVAGHAMPDDADAILAASTPGMQTPQAPGLLDLKHELSAAQKRGLDLITFKDFFRVTGGWAARGRYRLRTDTVNTLKRHQLVFEKRTWNNVTLRPTLNGKVLADMIAAERKGRRT